MIQSINNVAVFVKVYIRFFSSIKNYLQRTTGGLQAILMPHDSIKYDIFHYTGSNLPLVCISKE